MSKSKMRKYYFAMIGEYCNIFGLWGYEGQVHKELMVGYGINTTTQLTEEERSQYISFCILLYVEWHKILFDCDRYKNENISFTFLDF